MTARAERRPRALRGDIEGLRAVAVLLVLLYHAGVPGITGGFAGVDVFFVISGFLITSLLLRELARTGTISIAGFYARRARRLLPAATLVLLVVGAASYAVLPDGRHADLGSDVLTASLYVINWGLAARSVDYLAEDADPSVLQHYWSLSVEEQFYVVWPVVIAVVAVVAARRHLRRTQVTAGALALVTAASLGWSVVHTASSPGTAYFVTTTRIWELGAGALLAFAVTRLAGLGRVAAEGLALAGVVLLLASAVLVDAGTPWPGSAALLPVLGTAAVIAAGCSTTGTGVGRALGVAPMRLVGGLSYSLYLWHWPLLVLLEELRPGQGLPARLAVVVLAGVLAWLTKRYVEDPVRFHRGLAVAPPRALVAGGTAMAASAALGTMLLVTAPRLADEPPVQAEGARALVDDLDETGPGGDGGESSDGGTADPTPTASPESAATRTGEVYPDPALAPEDVPELYDQGCQLPVADTEPLACEFGDTSSETVLAVVGVDSKIAQWMPALDRIGEQEGWLVRSYTKSACAFTAAELEVDDTAYTQCTQWGHNVLAELTGPEAPTAVITSGGSPEALAAGGQSTRAALVEGYVSHWSALQDAGVPVVVLTDNPHSGGELYTCVDDNPQDYGVCAFPVEPGRGTPALRAAAEQLTGVEVIDLTSWLCPGGECPAVIGNVMVYRQGTHLTATFVKTLAPVLRSALAPRVEEALAP